MERQIDVFIKECKNCHLVDTGDYKNPPKYCEGKQSCVPNTKPCCCQHCCTCGG
jgi:hypothetical protein